MAQNVNTLIDQSTLLKNCTKVEIYIVTQKLYVSMYRNILINK